MEVLQCRASRSTLDLSDQSWQGRGLQRVEGGSFERATPCPSKNALRPPSRRSGRAVRCHAGSALSGPAAACARCSACSWYSEAAPSRYTCSPRGCPWGRGWGRPGSRKAGEREDTGRRPGRRSEGWQRCLGALALLCTRGRLPVPAISATVVLHPQPNLPQQPVFRGAARTSGDEAMIQSALFLPCLTAFS